jgi:transcriptional regulator with XRE-family HTH domain
MFFKYVIFYLRGVIIVFYYTALKDWRIKHNYTKSQMADLLDLSNSHYGYIENGDRQPSTKVITKMIELTHLSPNVFFPYNNTNIIDSMKLQDRFMDLKKENLKLQQLIFDKEIEIAKVNFIIKILEEIIIFSVKAIHKGYSIDKYRDEVEDIMKISIQKGVTHDIICNAFDININALKK